MELSTPDNEERYVEKRAQFVERRYSVRRTQAEIVAWSELGYSSYGIADQMDMSHGSITSNMKKINDVHPRALETRTDDFDTDSEFPPV